MITMVREREMTGLRSPLRSPWRSRSPKWAAEDIGGCRTPKIGDYATPRRSTSTWADSAVMGYNTAPVTPRRSTSAWPEDLAGCDTTSGTSRRSMSTWDEANMAGYDTTAGGDYEPPRRSTTRMRGSRDVTGFSTPQRITLMGREREVVEFRTPQHPLTGTNNWGTASPLLNRNVPKESLVTSYLRFNPLASYIDDNDEVFVGKWMPPQMVAPSPAEFGHKVGSRPGSRRRRFLSKLMWWRKEEKVLESDHRSRNGGGEHSGRWPQGW